MSFSGAQDGPRKAVQWLSMKFNSPHLLLPKVYQAIKDMTPARSQTEVPWVLERLLCQVESISALQQGDGKSLPADVTQFIFNALNLNIDEKKQVLPLLEDNRGVTISVMRACIAEMITSALGPGPKPNLVPPPSCFKPADIAANSATTQVSDKYEDEDGEDEGDEEQPSDSSGEANNVEPDEAE